MDVMLGLERSEIAELCRQYHVRRFSVFGSAVRDDFHPGSSDVDVIVDFDDIPIEEYSDNKWALHRALTEKWNRRVDLLTWKSLKNPVIRKEIESTHVTLYAA